MSNASTLHQLAIGLRIPEKTLHAWNKRFNIQPQPNAQGDLLYSPEQKALVLRLHYLIKEQKYTLAGAQKQLQQPDFRATREATVQRLGEIRGFLQGLKQQLDQPVEEE